MKPPGTWLCRLVLAGSSLAWAGCGGSDVPDPDSDSAAATDKPASVVDKASAPAEEAAPAAPTRPEPKADAQASGPKPPAVEPEPAAAPTPAVVEAEKPATPPAEASAPTDSQAAKGDASGTEEMMRIASAPAPATPPATGDAAPAPASTPAPSPATAGGLAMPGAIPNPAAIAAAPAGGAGRRRGGAGDETVAAGGPVAGAMPGGGGGGGAFGGLNGAQGGGGDAATPASFNQPTRSVTAFLAALKAKSKDQLAEATARRSATEAVEKHRKIFAEIIEGSISDVELDEMAKSMEGYQVMYQLPAKSTGRIGVVIAKQEGRDRLQRTVIVRKENDGWKVMDIEGAYDFKPVGNFRRTGRR